MKTYLYLFLEFFKIGLFFQRIFRANKECKCGIAHY